MPGTHILILGQSNSAGVQLVTPDDTWPRLFERALPQLTGSPCTVTVRPFYSHVPGAEEYLERELAKHQADVIILMLTSFAFLEPVVGQGVRRRFGNRAGDAYQWLESRFDRATRHRGPLPSKANRLARGVAHALLGAAPVASYETVLDSTVAAMRRLAREEYVQVVAFHGFVRLGRRERARATLLRRFLDETRVAASQLRVVHIDMQESAERAGDSYFFPDGVHVNAAGHEAVAGVLLAAFRDGRLKSGHLAG